MNGLNRDGNGEAASNGTSLNLKPLDPEARKTKTAILDTLTTLALGSDSSQPNDSDADQGCCFP